MRLISIFLLLSFSLSAESLKVGWIGPLTGNAALVGIDSANAARMVFEEANQQQPNRFELLIEDDQYLTSKAVGAYNKLVHQDGVRVIYVLTNGAIFTLAPRAEKDNVLLINPLDCDEKIAKLPSNTLCVSCTTESIAKIIVEHVMQMKNDPTGIIYYNSDPFMGILAESSQEFFNSKGGKLAFYEGYPKDTTDFRTMLIKAKQRRIKSLFFYGYDELGIAMKQARQLGINAKFYTINTVSSPGFQKSAGDALEDTIVSTWLAPRNPGLQGFLSKYQKRYKKLPDFEVSGVPSYDIAKIIVDSVSESLSNQQDFMQSVKQKFYSLKDHKGLSGTITMDSDGAVRSIEAQMKLFKAGKLNDM